MRVTRTPHLTQRVNCFVQELFAACNEDGANFVLNDEEAYQCAKIIAVYNDLKLCTGNNVEQQQYRPLSPMMRAEVRKLDKYLEEYKLLCDQHIESLEGLVSFKDNLSSQITALEQERYAVRLKIRRAKTPEEDAALKERAKAITKQITPLRKQRDIAIRIEERIPKMQELIEQERNIEMQRNHLVKKKERNFER